MRMKINDYEYKRQLREYLDRVGPNEGKGFYGQWAWQILKEDEFKQKLIKEGKLEYS